MRGPRNSPRRLIHRPAGRRAGRQPRRLRAVKPSMTVQHRPFRLTGRSVILALAVIAVGLSLAHPLHAYLAQRNRIHDLQAQEQATQHDIARLQQRQQQWADPTYVAQQARERLHFVLPGETAYIVVGAPPRAATPKSTTRVVSGTWSAKLWSSVVSAGQVPHGTRSR